jgi:hypothetical protein
MLSLGVDPSTLSDTDFQNYKISTALVKTSLVSLL